MNCNHYTTNRKKGKHLTLVERGKLEILFKSNKTAKEIAMEIGVSERTIYREKKRGMVNGILNSDLTTRNEYVAEKAHNRYLKLQKAKEGSLKIGNNIQLAEFIERQILNNKVSPYAALELAKQERFEVNFCVKTLYNYIHNGLFFELSTQHLPYLKKHKKSKVIKKRIRKLGGKSIEERAESINKRLEVGHWEMDTVLGTKGKKSCLLVLTERKSRKQIIEKINQKNSDSVIEGLKRILNRYPSTSRKRFLSITSDNGSEFMNAEAIENLGISYFYAHSYCSWERGSNENANKLIRRFIPKGVDIDTISKKRIKEIERWINNYPRQLFHGKTSEEIYKNFFRKI